MDQAPISLSNKDCNRLAALIHMSTKKLGLDPVQEGIPYELWSYLNPYHKFNKPNFTLRIYPPGATSIAKFCLRVYRWRNDIPCLEEKSYDGDYLAMIADIQLLENS